ncbi:mannose-1-phosphate guanylyltransferase/mannose-6-phosphate isomerase [Shewanella colwelliana]|uniref:mannose-1-phosphate guanylyltransferase/mannose-6-phosphate isomerase n=1 Tax=Shewanella colwelliana TaxID=23 RepID=UPI0022AF1703|nr:mannose-1-phosphate guanylyltransferase/mannose-6-phosphate isomerase [Shewanella colwelliana]MCZ4336714.1 mannose-1-phosphate guanylyltransferase/mannose-6-phosphate isomerase [Shewanella colwelliana]
MILPVIMAGGNGTRLWPLSRGLFPKQFLTLTGNQSMLQHTVQRLSALEHIPPLLICNENHRFIAAEQCRSAGFDHSGIILEPVGRNTAPAIALAAFKAMSTEDDPTLLILAADHIIEDNESFCSAVAVAEKFALQGKLVTFGIITTHAETGYGYVKRGRQIEEGFFVEEFVEKPDIETARAYVDSGDFYWNSGMFMFKASCYLAELKKYRPDIYSACERAFANHQSDLEFIRIDKDAFCECPDESIDYAVMEKTRDGIVIPLSAGWNDIGGFAALWETSIKDSSGNAFCGDVLTTSTTNCYINTDNKLVATVGVDNLVIISTKDAVLVADKSSAQNVKAIVEQLKLENRSEMTFHREVYRPWGKYDSVDAGDRFQVKRITVKPGAKLSVQMHHHRAEHWIVVSGTALVHIDGKEQFVTENESVYIPITAVHALENPGKVPLELIEVQSGSYLGEDDIIRFEDRYGRS